MKNYCLLLSAMVLSLIITACHNNQSTDYEINIIKNTENERSDIQIPKSNLEQVVSLISELYWETAKVQMVREPDFKVEIKNKANELKNYNVWVTNNVVEMTQVGNDKYTKLDEGTSNSLLNLLEPSKKDTP
ncbi:hypothetical protein ACQCVH_19520 [Bacillus infantis]|uniref:hypothetical protein n=1 Tax=Bacillus infantis TaxID=324767 RepID=UPI003CEB4457